MHDELNIPQKMLELSAIAAFQPMKMELKRKFHSNGHFRPHLTSASSDFSNEEQRFEDEDDDSRASSTLVGNGDLIKTDTKLSNGDINLPSPPSSTRSSFDNDGVTRDSFISNGDNSDNVADVDGSYVPDSDVILEGHNELNDQTNNDTFEDDIKLVTENLVKLVAEEFESNETKVDIEAMWDNITINEVGETILPSGLRLVDGVVDMPFYHENTSIPPRFTNQLNFLKTILTKYICRYKSAMPFLNPVDSVRFKIPHYYRVIRRPMDLNTVKNRINFLWYRNADECISDIRLIFSNCYQFNSPTDYVHKTGKKLEEYLDEKLKEMPPVESEIPCPPVPSLEEYLKLNSKNKQQPKQRTDSISSENGGDSMSALYSPIKMITRSERGVMVRKPSKDLPTPISTPQPKAPSTRKVPLNESMKYCHDFVKELFNKKHAEYAWPFWEAVKLRDYPDYLQKIKRPIDLSTIRANIETGKYSTVSDFANDMRLMFSNCLRYNKPESPIIEQARKLREVFEYKYARIPEEWLHEKLVVPHTSNGRTTSPSVRQTSASLPSLKPHMESFKIKKSKTHSESKKSPKIRNSVDNSGQYNTLGRSNGPSTSTGGESRMELLERQVANLTNALQACLGYGNGTDQTARSAIMNAMMPPASIVPNGTKPGRGRPRKNGLEPKNANKKTTKKQPAVSRKRKHHLSSEEESDSDDEIGQVGSLAEPINFNPEDIENLKKLKNDLENLRAKDLQNVLRILQATEPSLRCDDESNVEIDFEALKPKTLIALRKYVTSCMLNAKSPPSSNSASTSHPTTTVNSSNKKICHSNTLRSVSNLDTDCDNPTINNWPRAASRASDLQLSESSSSDSEIDD